MVGILHCAQHDAGDVGEVCAPGLLVDRADVELGVFWGGGVDCKHVHQRQRREKHLGGGLNQTAVPPVPTGTIQKQAEHVHTLLWREDQQWIEVLIRGFEKRGETCFSREHGKCCPVQVAAGTYGRCRGDLLLGLLQHLVVQSDRVQCPAFVSAGHFLPHGSQEPCGGEKTR